MKAKQQAQMIYEFCVLKAKDGKTLTYRELLDHMGYDVGATGHAIRFGLELAWIACSHNNLPSLTSIVVNKATGAPSPSGFPVPEWEKVAQNVFKQKNWPGVGEIDWDYIWDHRKELSNTYATSGYWG